MMNQEHNLDQQIWDAEAAKQLIGNRVFQMALEKLRVYLEERALKCDPDNLEKASRIIISKQLLAGIQREIFRIIENGEAAKAKIAEIEKSSTLKEVVFRR